MSEIKHLGVLENMLAGMIFFSPNFLFLFPYFRDKIFLFILYNYIIIFILTSTISHLKFNDTENKRLNIGIKRIIDDVDKIKKK